MQNILEKLVIDFNEQGGKGGGSLWEMLGWDSQSFRHLEAIQILFSRFGYSLRIHHRQDQRMVILLDGHTSSQYQPTPDKLALALTSWLYDHKSPVAVWITDIERSGAFAAFCKCSGLRIRYPDGELRMPSIFAILPAPSTEQAI